MSVGDGLGNALANTPAIANSMANTGAPALDLRDIHLAPPPQFWPPAPGWWLLGVLALALLLLLGRWLYRGYRRHREQQRVLRELKNLESDGTNRDCAALATAVSTLLRRVALTRYPRRRVASLSGSQWLQFLDDTGGNGEFAGGPGRVLKDAPYTPAQQSFDAEPLLALAHRWLKRNRVQPPGANP